jgi:putative ATP-dependent endonuclease of OLD family
MFLTRIEIRNFRNLASFILDLAETTVIIGENNAGKSNILDAIFIGLRNNRPVREAPFEIYDYRLENANGQPGDCGQISIVAQFREPPDSEWDPDLIASVSDAIAINGEKREINISITATAAKEEAPESWEWAFLDQTGALLGNRARWVSAINAIQKLRPFFYLDAFRAATKDFAQRAPFWSPFISRPTFKPEAVLELEKTLAELNKQIVDANESFATLEKNLSLAHKIVELKSDKGITLEPIPSRLADLLARTQVSATSTSGATIPLDHHGAGTQSVSVLLLFKAYIEALLSLNNDELSRPILALEEPEAHSHRQFEPYGLYCNP